MLALRGDCLSRVDFPSWFVVRKDIRTVKSTLSISKISPPKPHVRPLLIGIYCIDLLVSHLNTSINNIHFLQTSTGYLMTFMIVMGFHQIIVVMNDVKQHTYIHTIIKIFYRSTPKPFQVLFILL